MQYKLRDMSWSEFAQRSKTAKTIILPSGACEVYGPHNPLGADILVAKKMSEMLAERIDGIVGPCLEVGQSKSLTSFPGTIAISGETLKACLLYTSYCPAKNSVSFATSALSSSFI